MSTEPKYPKHSPVTVFSRTTVGAPDGFYLLDAGARLTQGDLNLTFSGEWVPLNTFLEDDTVPVTWAWTYARRLPEGQANDDTLPAPARRIGRWAWSTDEENFQGECDSAEAAFIEGAGQNGLEGLDDDQTLYVGQIDEPDPVPGVTADRVLEWVEEYLSDDAPDSIDEILPRPSAVQKAALEEALRSAYRGWLAANPDQKPQWFRIKGKVLEKTGAEIRELSAPET